MEHLIEKIEDKIFPHHPWYKKKAFLWSAGVLLSLILLTLSFGGGMFLARKNKVVMAAADNEVAYLGKVTGKYGTQNELKTQDVDFSLFWKVWDTVKNEYVGKDNLDEKKMFYGALRGLVASAGDPYTVFMDPKVTNDFTSDMAGTFEGVGMEIGLKNDILTVISPLDGTPAWTAGILAGDKIAAINGTSTVGMSVEEAVSKIRGPKDTEVTLSIYRNGFKTAKDFKIKRDTILVKSVKTSFDDKNKIFTIKITSFNNDTKNLFDQAVNEVLKKNPKGIIVDLRNNPGGYLETAVSLASAWIENDVVVSEKNAAGNKTDTYSRGTARLKNYKTVVLINAGSASASEILSGALHDYGKATLVGVKSFGKGSVQTIENFDDGSSVKVTIAEWLTPKGININKQGIEPDIKVDMTEQDYNDSKDPQMDKAIEVINNEKLIINN
jgi:carboxyl-terminal processing protease